MSRDAQSQFGRQAAFYAISRTHSQGESLQVLKELANAQGHEVAVDIGTGAGFTAFAIAEGARSVVATDITRPMLHEAHRLRAERGLQNVHLALAAGECLPFKESSLDMVTCRQAFHHFQQLPKSIAEIYSVLKPEGKLVVSDTVSPEDDAITRWLNDVERRRDTSHVYDLKVSEWQSLLSAAGFRVTHIVMARTELEFHDWTRRSGTPEPAITKLKQDFLSATPGAAGQFRIKPSGDRIEFSWEVAVIRAVKPQR